MEISLDTVFKILRKYAVLIIIVAVVCAVGAYGASSYLIKPTYQAKAQINIVPYQIDEQEGKQNISGNSTGWSLALRATETCGGILKANDYTSAVKGALNLDYEPNLNFTYDDGSTTLITLTVTDKNPEKAYEIALTAVNGASEWIKDKTSGTISATVSDYPELPKEPYSPNPLKNAIIAMLCGAVLVFAIAFMREVFGTKVKNEEELAKRYPDIPVLASVPDFDANIKASAYGARGGRENG